MASAAVEMLADQRSDIEKYPDLAMAVVVRNGLVLVQQRDRRSKCRVFEFPGGAIDFAETGEQAAIRELYEETGIKRLPVLGIHTGTNEYGGTISYVVLSNNTDQKPVITQSYREQKFYWLEPVDIPRDDFYPADIEFIDTSLPLYTRLCNPLPATDSVDGRDRS